MIYLKSLRAGIVGAMLGIVVSVLIALGPLVVNLRQPRGAGSGGIGAVSSGIGYVLLPVLIGFAVGSAWQFRRTSRRRTR